MLVWFLLGLNLKWFRRFFQIPPDLVVKYQAIDIVELIFSLIWRQNIVQTSCRNRKWRCEPLSPSEVHRATTKSGGIRKNQGYNFEHNYGHGEQHLSVVFAMCQLGQNAVVGSMTLLLAVRGNIATRSMSGPPFSLQLYLSLIHI